MRARHAARALWALAHVLPAASAPAPGSVSQPVREGQGLSFSRSLLPSPAWVMHVARRFYARRASSLRAQEVAMASLALMKMGAHACLLQAGASGSADRRGAGRSAGRGAGNGHGHAGAAEVGAAAASRAVPVPMQSAVAASAAAAAQDVGKANSNASVKDWRARHAARVAQASPLLASAAAADPAYMRRLRALLRAASVRQARRARLEWWLRVREVAAKWCRRRYRKARSKRIRRLRRQLEARQRAAAGAAAATASTAAAAAAAR